MKKLTILALFVGLLSSCTPSEYAAKDRDGAPILIRDTEGIIADAIKLGLDSIYVKRFDMDEFYRPLRQMGKEQTIVTSDTIGGKRYTWFSTYRVIHVNNLIKR